jgi:hypothetical protein
MTEPPLAAPAIYLRPARQRRPLGPARPLIGGPVRVLLIDANVVIRDLTWLVKHPDQQSALMELALAPQVRLVMSAADIQPHPSGRSRLEHNIWTAQPALAPRMTELWQRRLQPQIHVLDPAGFVDTPLSRSVRSPGRDPDDADLVLLGHLLGAHGLLTYDLQAFGDRPGEVPLGVPVLTRSGAHGEVLSSFRDELRVEQTTAEYAVPFLWLAKRAHTVIHAAARRWHVAPGWLMGGVAAAAALSLLRPRVREDVTRALGLGAVRLYQEIGIDEHERQAIRQARAKAEIDWGPAGQGVVAALRHLARTPDSLTSTALVRQLGLLLTPGELAALFRQAPGMVTEVSRGRWRLKPATGRKETT